MKKIINILFIVVVATVTATAQGVRIGNLEITVKKTERDTVTQITIDEPCPPCPSENETRPKRNPYKYHTSSCFFAMGFILPDNGADYYTILGGNSINLDLGWNHRYQLGKRFALGGVFHYSFYNYKLRNVVTDPTFSAEVIGRAIDPADIDKQVYRSNNLAAGVFTRFYLIPPAKKYHKSDNYVEIEIGGKDGMFFDLGIQGDFAFGRYCKLNTHSSGKDKYHDSYAFNPFGTSAFARVGFSWLTLYARYRITDAFNKNALPLDLPRWTIGIVL